MVDLASVVSLANELVEPEPVTKPTPVEVTRAKPVSLPEPPPLVEPVVEEMPMTQAMNAEPMIEEPVVDTLTPEEPSFIEPIVKIPVPEQPVQAVEEVPPPQTELNEAVAVTETTPAVDKNIRPSPATLPRTTTPRSDVAYLNNTNPVYPLSARRRRLEGMVLLEVAVDRHGWPEAVYIKESSGHGVLDNAARWAVEKWRFIPATKNGDDVAAVVEVPIRFALN